MKSPRLTLAAVAALCVPPVLTPSASAQSVPLGYAVGNYAGTPSRST